MQYTLGLTSISESGIHPTHDDPDHVDHRVAEDLTVSEGVKGTVDEWLPGHKKELQEVTRRRFLAVPEDYISDAGRKAVRIRMRLEHKTDGRRKGGLILQGFREPSSWDRDGIDSPTASLASVRTLLFIAGMQGEVFSSIAVSTAFIQANDHPEHIEPRYVSYQPYAGAKKLYYRLPGYPCGQRAAGME